MARPSAVMASYHAIIDVMSLAIVTKRFVSIVSTLLNWVISQCSQISLPLVVVLMVAGVVLVVSPVVVVSIATMRVFLFSFVSLGNPFCFSLNLLLHEGYGLYGQPRSD
uniref:Uncharacterized protein n=1 Tax=Tanacetum cinerariifolium TaxID=118510 RepID=A0A699R3D4_TANCI|nr:hypothetical protein [Tanacetum cinerariifolium]